ncbi:laccase-1 isoform X1 [Fagus crenata]
MVGLCNYCKLLIVTLVLLAGLHPSYSSLTTTRRFKFNVEWKKVKRLCNTKPLLTVNGKYPGPTIAVHEGDNVEIKVTNRIAMNTTIHCKDNQLLYRPAHSPDTFIQTVERGKIYLLRIINAALNDELFFAIDNHTLTVVEADAVYVKPFTTKAILVAPGQTTNVLVTTNQVPDSTSMFVMAARPYVTTVFPFNNSTTVGFLKYNSTPKTGKIEVPTLPKSLALPKMRDTTFAKKFSDKIRSLASPKYPCNVPKKIDKRVITTISLNLQDCPANKTCKGYANKRFLGSMNNQSFLLPAKSILESYYKNRTHTYSSDFPEKPPNPFNYTGVDPFTENMNTEFGTKLLTFISGFKILEGSITVSMVSTILFASHDFYLRSIRRLGLKLSRLFLVLRTLKWYKMYELPILL